MKITLIAAALPPQLDGIGDYTAHLAAELAKSAQVTVLTGAEMPASIPGVRIETAFDACEPRSVWNVVERIAEDRPEWVLLQYNPFSYGRWGMNLHLPEAMRQVKQKCPDVKIAVMVHEPFVPIIDAKFAVMATWQRWQLWRLGQAANVLFFSIDAWTQRFGHWFSGKPVIHLPVGSNVPHVSIRREEAKARLGISEETIVLGLFGNAGSGRMLERARDAAEALRRASIPAAILYIGQDKDKICAALGNNTLIAEGPFPGEEVSRRLAAIDIYLAAYVDGVSTRRGAFIAALQHGLAIVGTRGPLTDSILDRENGQAFLLADVNAPEAFDRGVKRLAQNAERRMRLGDKAQQLFSQEFSWDQSARTLKNHLLT